MFGMHQKAVIQCCLARGMCKFINPIFTAINVLVAIGIFPCSYKI